jgi:hypothetical protein
VLIARLDLQNRLESTHKSNHAGTGPGALILFGVVLVLWVKGPLLARYSAAEISLRS